MRFFTDTLLCALMAVQVRAAITRFTLLAGLCALVLPSLAWADAHCDSVTAGAIRDRTDVPAFVECAHAYATHHGSAEAARAFREDERWRYGSIYVFVHRQGTGGSAATSYVFPPDPAREGQPWGPLVDEFGTDYFVETNRIFNVLDASAAGSAGGPAAGWMYYSFTNPATGRSEPKASYLMALEWNREPALIGVGLYERDIPATCYAEHVNASQLDTAPGDEMLARFVRCAAMVIERKGFFGVAALAAERWRHGSVYVFGVDANSGVQLFTTSPQTVKGMQLMEGLDDRDPMGRFAGRDAPAVGSAFDEAYLYYDGYNPATGLTQGKVTFVKRVIVQGAPILVGSGYYPMAATPAAGESFSEEYPAPVGFKPARGAAQGAAALVPRAAARLRTAPPASAAPVESWTNTVGMHFVWIRPGTFQMGSPTDEARRERDEVQHTVRLTAGYWMGMHEVTREEWRQVMGSYPPSQPEHCGRGCPVVQVSWEDTQKFIRKLHEKESRWGYRYRLPTEAEWEYAARAGTTTARYGEFDAIAWHKGNSDYKLQRVGKKQANPWGLHDMLGNAWEWTADWYGPYRTNPVRSEDPVGPRTGKYRVIRGGDWGGDAGELRAARRSATSPGRRTDGLGFRLVRTDPLTPVPGVVWKNPLGMELAWIPPGTFQMGSPADEEDRSSDERQHQVTISAGYWMGRYEVQEGEWEAVMGSNPAYPGCSVNCPVTQVSWFDVQEFLARLNERESKSKVDAHAPWKGYVYRLPTEAEWEYAARAGTTGARHGELDAIAWYTGNSLYRERLHEVGQKRANAWGLHDMLGNVQEWTATRYGEYPSSGVTDPRGPGKGWPRVLRGGAINESPWRLRSAHRREGSPSFGGVTFGFRVVKGRPPLPPVPGETWSNSVDTEFVWIPAGKFRMGSPADEEGRQADEVQHKVYISKGYWMGKYEVTRGEWERVMGSPFRRYDSLRHYDYCDGPECPVDSVTWPEAQEFVRKLNERESAYGYRYRLPTEAEWEYAARAGTTGARYGDLDEVAIWFSPEATDEWEDWRFTLIGPGPPGPTPSLYPVGQKRANAWGIHDMLGNAWEWTGDWYGAYPSNTVADPTGPSTGRFRVLRGGAWNSLKINVRSAMRATPIQGRTQYFVNGFRLVRTN